MARTMARSGARARVGGRGRGRSRSILGILSQGKDSSIPPRHPLLHPLKPLLPDLPAKSHIPSWLVIHLLLLTPCEIPPTSYLIPPTS